MATQDVRFVIAVEDAGAIRKLTETEQALYNLRGGAKQAEGAFGGLWKQFAIGNIAVNALQKGFGLLKGFIEDGIKGAIEEEQSQHRLNTALNMTGRTRQFAASSLLDFAKEQMRVTTYTHEEIEAVMTLLAQLTKLDGQGLRQATQGAMGLASVLGMDLQSAALMVTKAMEGNTQALARVGIRIDENIPKEQQSAAILEKLVALYPRATAELETMAGQLKNTKNLWGEFKENIGKAFLEATYAADFLKLTTEGLKKLNTESENVNGTWKDLNVQFAAARGLIPPIVVQQLAEKDAIEKTLEPSMQLLEIHKSMGAVLAPIPSKIQAVTFALKAASLEASSSRSNWLSALGGMSYGVGQTAMPSAFSTNQAVWKKQLEWLGVTTKATTAKMSDYFAGLYNDIATGFGNAMEGFKFSLTGIKDFFVNIWEMIKQAFFRIIGQMIAKWLIFKAITGALNFFVPGLGSAFSAAAGLVKAASGFEGVVTRPTLFLGGESGPERVSIRPMAAAGAGGGGMVLNFNSPLISTTGLSRSDLESAGQELVRVINSQLRRVGRSL